jgi:SHS2 domain-containing protein
MEGRGHRQVEHTADLALDVWAPSEEALLVEAARALVDCLEGDRTPGDRAAGDRRSRESRAPLGTRELAFECIDPEDRLVQWLNEVLFLATVEAFLVRDAEIHLEPTHLRARVYGEAADPTRPLAEIKSATYHELRLEHSSDGARAHVVLDV